MAEDIKLPTEVDVYHIAYEVGLLALPRVCPYHTKDSDSDEVTAHKLVLLDAWRRGELHGSRERTLDLDWVDSPDQHYV